MFFVLAADPFLGKVDKQSLSQQTLMELLIENISNKEVICGSSENSKEVTEWAGVSVDMRNEISRLMWRRRELQGTIELKWLPLSCEKVNLAKNMLTGTVDLTCLPGGLVFLSLRENRFHGTIDMTYLPSGLQHLYLYENTLSGSTDFSQLPKSLRTLNMSNTHLEGEIFEFDGALSIDGSKVKDMRKM